MVSKPHTTAHKRYRHILHVDMDAFYAAVEIRDRPGLQNRPVIIGGENRGVVSTCCYRARKYGIHSAMPIYRAKQLCPHALYLKPDMDKYRRVSEEIKEIFSSYTPLVEPLSLDEAFLDVTGSRALFGHSLKIGKDIQTRIMDQLKLTASVGIAGNKFVAKVASDMKKPGGLLYVPQGYERGFLAPLPITKLWGAGHRTTALLKQYGFFKIRDLQKASKSHLSFLKKSQRDSLLSLAMGIDPRQVTPEESPQSIGQEQTFPRDIPLGVQHLNTYLLKFSEQVGARLRKQGYQGKTITVKIKDPDFNVTTRQKTISPTDQDQVIYRVARDILAELARSKVADTRLLGVTVSNLTPKEVSQLTLSDMQDHNGELQSALDKMRDKYGNHIIQRARLLEEEDRD